MNASEFDRRSPMCWVPMPGTQVRCLVMDRQHAGQHLNEYRGESWPRHTDERREPRPRPSRP